MSRIKLELLYVNAFRLERNGLAVVDGYGDAFEEVVVVLLSDFVGGDFFGGKAYLFTAEYVGFYRAQIELRAFVCDSHYYFILFIRIALDVDVFVREFNRDFCS